MNLSSLLLLLLATLQLSIQDDKADDARTSLAIKKTDAEVMLRQALIGVHNSVLVEPVKELREILQAGYNDLKNIMSFQVDADKSVAIDFSLRFWKAKMDEVIQPYISSPESYKGAVISGEKTLPDPVWNVSEAYRQTEKELNSKVENATQSLILQYQFLTKEGPKRLEEVTLTTWRRAASAWALDAALMSIRRQAQQSKHDAANGKIDKATNWLVRVIKSASANFKANVRDIYLDSAPPNSTI